MSRDHSIECPACGESYGGMNAESEEHECDPVRVARIRELLDEDEPSDHDVITSWPPDLVHNLITDGGETCDDDQCWWHVGRPALERLAVNLAVAGALAYAYQLGAGIIVADANAVTPWAHIWADGTGEIAPKWRKRC